MPISSLDVKKRGQLESVSKAEEKAPMWPNPLGEEEINALADMLENLLKSDKHSAQESENYTKMTFKESQR